MRSIIILADLADQGVNEVKTILYDWYLSGLVQPVVWLDAKPGERTVHAVVKNSEMRLPLGVWLDKYLPSSQAPELYVFQAPRDDSGYLDETQVDEALRGHPVLLAAEPRLVNVFAPSSAPNSMPDTVLLSYRTNIAILPAQGASGLAGYKLLTVYTSEFFANAASGLASATGIWSGLVSNHLYELSPPKQRKPQLIMLRSFCRYADASELLEGLVQDATILDDGLLPCAYDEFGQKLTPLAQESSKDRAIKVSENFMLRHKKKFEFDESKFRDRPTLDPEPLSSKEMLRQYWLYLRRYFQIGAWAREKLALYKASAARSLQAMFLGEASAREVFVMGVGADTPRNDDSTLSAIDALLMASELVSNSVVEPALTNPNEIWSDYVSTLTALVDGAEGPPEIQLPGVIGGDRRLVLDSRDLMPPPNVSSFRVPESLPIRLRGEVVSPSDPYLAKVLDNQLEQVIRHPHNYSPVEIAATQAARYSLELWINDLDSFAWRVGKRLADSLDRARDILGAIVPPPDLDDSEQQLYDLEAKARAAVGGIIKGALGVIGVASMAWVLQGLWIFLAVSAWPVALATWWYWPAMIVAGLLGIWATLGFRRFAGAVRDIYKFENKAKFDDEIAQWVEKIRPALRSEIAKLGDLYKQLEFWNRLIRPAIFDPMGKSEKQNGEFHSIKNLNQLTTSIQLAEFTSESLEREKLLNSIKAKLFSRGWLHRRLIQHLIELGADFPRTWSDTAHEDKSALRQMLLASSPQKSRISLGRMTNLEVQELARDLADYSSWPVKILNLDRELGCDEYLGGLAIGIGVLPNELLSDRAAVRGAGRIDPSTSIYAHDPRISFESDVSTVFMTSNAVSAARRLDLLSVRIEVSKPVNASEFSPLVVTEVEELLFSEQEASPPA
jgi:hypothetical protein